MLKTFCFCWTSQGAYFFNIYISVYNKFSIPSQSLNVPNASRYFSSIVEGRIVVPEAVDPSYMSSNIKTKQEVTYEDVPFSAINPELSTLSVNNKREVIFL